MCDVGYKSLSFVGCYPCVLTVGYTVLFRTQEDIIIDVYILDLDVPSSPLDLAKILADRLEDALKQMQPKVSNPRTRTGLRQIEV